MMWDYIFDIFNFFFRQINDILSPFILSVSKKNKTKPK